MKLVALLVAGIAAWRLLRRRTGENRVTVGWMDGSSIELDAGQRQRERLLATAAGVLR